MNICLISTGHPPDEGGGIGTYIANLADGLVKKGHSVFIIAPSTSGKDSYELLNGLLIVRARKRYYPKIEKYVPGLAWSIYVAKKIAELDRKYRLDIIEFPNWEGVGYWYIRKKIRKPVVVRMHTPYLETLTIDNEHTSLTIGDKFTCWIEKQSCLLSDTLTASTECHRRFMSQIYNIEEERTKILPLGIPVVNAYNTNIKNYESNEVKKNRVLYVSRLEKRKGALLLLDAIPHVIEKYPFTEFILIGKDRPHAPNGMYHKEYFEVNYAQYAENVKFMGYVENSELDRYYSEADIFVVPSIYESFGLVYIEAMAYGLPVIGGCGGGIPEVIRDGVTGIVLKDMNPLSLADKIMNLLGSSELRKTLGREGEKSVNETFNSDVMSQNSAALYRVVINRNEKTI